MGNGYNGSRTLPIPTNRGTMSSFESLESVRDQARRMRAAFDSGLTRPLAFRKQALVQLRDALRANEDRILEALTADLGKSAFEGYATELGLVYDEISTCLSRLGRWAKPKRVPTPLAHFTASSKVYPQPYGVVLVLSPWNYPLQLALVPIVDAIAAGNCVALKPSRESAHASEVMLSILEQAFPDEFVCGFPGSRSMNDWLLEAKWDKIFFTGSPRIGRTIMAAAARDLTPITLELGGKSPCIVHADANLRRAGERIAWGKGLNCGQTCVAPDYILAHESVVDDLVVELRRSFTAYYTDDALTCDWWPHMINKKHFGRVLGLIENRGERTAVAFGGGFDESTLRIEPTVMIGVTLDDAVMGEEIFGPVLPIVPYRDLDEAFAVVRTFPTPLATYVFSESREVQQRVIQELPFGGGCVNDTVVHLANNHMGFGGLGNSGMGAYHGKAGFDCFTHMKSALAKPTWCDVPVRNMPPASWKNKVIHLLMR